MMTKSDPARKPLLVVQLVLIGALLVTLTLAAINERSRRSSPAPNPTAIVIPSSTLDLRTATAAASATQPATAAPSLTPTPPPADTPVPTPTEQREPIIIVGHGDSIKYPQKWVGPALVRISHSGEESFLVWTQDQNAERVDLLARSLGPYHGESLIDFTGIQRTLRFEIRSTGDWQIEVLPISLARHEAVPGTFQGSDDGAIILQGPPPDLVTVDASAATGAFSVWSYGRTEDLLIQTTGPYSGTVAIPRDATAIAVKATGQWSIEVSTR